MGSATNLKLKKWNEFVKNGVYDGAVELLATIIAKEQEASQSQLGDYPIAWMSQIKYFISSSQLNIERTKRGKRNELCTHKFKNTK
jgi:hypothetical protein